MQALILAGGEGTRLRPLTATVPKPVVPLVDRPFIAFMLDWLRGHGIEEIVISCGFLAAGVRDVLGDGSAHGVRLRYVEEPRPLGTGGAIKFAEQHLDERFLVLNGDILCDIDLTAQLEAHDRRAAAVTLALIGVEDPSAYGLVRRRPDGTVREFLEKPSADQIDTNLVNAGVYVMEREVLAAIAPDRNVSIERDVFPTLVGSGLFGHEVGAAYWLDIGTPERYLQATHDILDGTVDSAVPATYDRRRIARGAGATVAGSVHGPVVIGAGAAIAAGAVVRGRSVIGPNVEIGAGAEIDGAVILDGATVGPDASVADAVVGRGSRIGARCRLGRLVMVGDGAEVGPDNHLEAGLRLAPNVTLPAGAIRF